jgi:hypothetical protein
MATWKCGAARDLSLNTEASWDGAAAQKSVFTWAGFDGDSPDAAKARRAFLAYDAEAPTKRGSYKLPFARYEGGKLEAVKAGLSAAAQRLSSTDIPQDVKDKAQAVIDAYAAKADDSQKGREMEEPSGWMAFPVRVLAGEERAALPDGLSDAELLKIAKKRAYDPSIFEDATPLFFPIAASTNKLDAYDTRMHTSSLRNFATDMETGVSFQDSHNTRTLGIGHTLTGRYIGAGGNGVERTVGDVFTAPISADTEAFIRKLRAGMVRDVSVGFYLGEDGKYVCDLCGEDVTGYYHEHWPGMTYEVSGKMKRATWSIHGARLAEVSAVYDGATPGAVIMKARQASEEGQLAPAMARLLEVQYRIHLPASHKSWAGAATVKHEEADMPDNDTRLKAEPEEGSLLIPQIRSLLKQAGLATEEPVPDLVRALVTEVGELRGLKVEVEALRTKTTEQAREIETLKPQAEMGAAYKRDLIEQVIAAGVAVHGNAFPAESRQKLLEGADLETIQAELKFNREAARQKWPSGRLTFDADPERESPPLPATPNAAYQA